MRQPKMIFLRLKLLQLPSNMSSTIWSALDFPIFRLLLSSLLTNGDWPTNRWTKPVGVESYDFFCCFSCSIVIGEVNFLLRYCHLVWGTVKKTKGPWEPHFGSPRGPREPSWHHQKRQKWPKSWLLAFVQINEFSEKILSTGMGNRQTLRAYRNPIKGP